jgi:NADH-quinone oxidoreductase subunit N
LWLLVILLVLASAVGLFYYLRLIVAMYMPLPQELEGSVVVPSVPWAGGLVLAALTLALVWLGVYPAPLIDLVQRAVAGLL